MSRFNHIHQKLSAICKVPFRMVESMNTRGFQTIFRFNPVEVERLSLKVSIQAILNLRDDERKRREEKIDQELVNLVLQQLAATMAYWFQVQEEVRSAKAVGWLKEAVDTMVKKEKIRFWRAHRLARRNGFSTQENFEDYLPQEAKEPVRS